MIKNERQYRITRAQADGLSRTLDSLSRSAGEAHPLIAKAQEDALRSQVEDLQGELRDYESLLSGGFPTGRPPSYRPAAGHAHKGAHRTGLEPEGACGAAGAEGAADTAVRGDGLRLRQPDEDQRGRRRSRRLRPAVVSLAPRHLAAAGACPLQPALRHIPHAVGTQRNGMTSPTVTSPYCADDAHPSC